MPMVSGSYHGITAQPQFQTYPTAGMLQVAPTPQAPQPPQPPAQLPTTTAPQPIMPTTPMGPWVPNVLPQFGVSYGSNEDAPSDQRGRLVRAMMNL